uniref:ARAD1B08690p n=1 Tax=Blastobotrys adeninivorans TaxID=409370 RepID=A0A060T5P1_BLAAD
MIETVSSTKPLPSSEIWAISMTERFGEDPGIRADHIRNASLVAWCIVTVIATTIAWLTVFCARKRALMALAQREDDEKSTGAMASLLSSDKLYSDALLKERQFHRQRIALAFLWVLCSGLVVFTVSGIMLSTKLQWYSGLLWVLLSVGPACWLLILTRYHIKGELIS